MSGPGRIPQRAQGAPSDRGSPVWSTGQDRQEKEKGCLPEESTGLLKEGEHMGPPGAWLFQTVDPESAEYPGGGQPPAHREGQL